MNKTSTTGTTRRKRVKKDEHKFYDILTIAICAIICGAEDWTEVEEYGKAKIDWLKTFLDLPGGIPPQEAFSRTFAVIPPDKLETNFNNWINEIHTIAKGRLMTGKRGARKKTATSDTGTVRSMSVQTAKNHILLRQDGAGRKYKSQSMAGLLKILDINGCTVTMDAMGHQQQLAQNIIDLGGNYCLAIRGNLSSLSKALKKHFSEVNSTLLKSPTYDFHQIRQDRPDGYELRSCCVTSSFADKRFRNWLDMHIIAVVESERHIGDKVTTDCRYYISSLTEINAAQFLEAVGQYADPTNKSKKIIGITFPKKVAPKRVKQATQNLAILRKIAQDLLDREKSHPAGKSKQLIAGWNNGYLAKILFG